ncbi:MAG: MEDS domain-containing protein, partial [Armatimonadota bacterium]|nr:MEDS domain-containing protein [Armatimonadota bacterium]
MNDCKNKQDMIDGANPGDCEHLPLGTLRRTGIDLIGDVPWGTHFCQFYQTKQDLIDILVPYFKTGLENNEFCMWVTSEPLGVDEAKASLKAVVPNLDRYLDNEQIEIISYTDWYVKDGGFERNRVLNGWVEKLNAALERGLDGLRLTGNTFWLEKSDWDDFTYYEQVVNEVIGNYKMLAICTYSLEKCGGVEVADVVSNHQFSLMKREGRWTIIESSEHKRTEQAQDALQNAMEKLAVANETLASNNEELTALNEELEVANEELRVSSDELLKEVERRRLAEESMRSLALFPDENPFPVLRVSSNGTILYANRASNPLLKEWGREAGERVPVNLHSLIREALDSNSNKIIDIDCEDRVSSFVFAPIPDQGYVNLYGRDVTERRHAEDEREISVEFLRLMNESAGTPELIRAAATFFQDKSGCKAVGIRLKDGDDYPYYVAQGFPREFVLLENSLCERDCDGGVIRDNSGYPICECMCGNVIQGRFDPSKPFFTEHGSFWTNCTTNLIATTEADRQARPRNRCNGEGYESVALIPIHLGDERLGLIQLNDRQKGRFTPEIIAFWERLADYLAVALAKFQAEEALRKSERRLNRSQEIAHLGSWELDLVKNELTWSDEVYRIFGLQPQEFAATYEAFLDVVHPDDRTAVDEAYSSSVREGKSTYEIQHRVVRKSTGEVRWVHERCEHIRDESGNIIRSIGMVMDITDR